MDFLLLDLELISFVYIIESQTENSRLMNIIHKNKDNPLQPFILQFNKS